MSRRIVIAALLAAGLNTPAAAAEARDIADPAAGYAMKLPAGWSEPSGGVTTSADGSVRCTMTGQDVPQSAALTQDQVNASMQAYSAEVWKSRFFTGGITGTIEHSGITRMEQYDAPWARGRLSYPNGAEAKFGVILLSAPGKLATVTCTATPAAYDAHLGEVTTVLNWLRPL